MAEDEERRQDDDKVIAALAVLEERWTAVVDRLGKIDDKLDIIDDLRVKVAKIEERGRLTYALLAVIVSGLISLAFKVMGG